MLYIDQPIGVGFSYGTDPVTSTVTAAPYVWTLLQAFFAQFPQYENRDFGIFTESYGGHYGPGMSLSYSHQLLLLTMQNLLHTSNPKTQPLHLAPSPARMYRL